jgi:hypothetical protein
VLQLAHFSVKEYLVSSRIHDELAAGFGLQKDLAHESLAECCLAYLLPFEHLMSYAELSAHPLALYSSEYWPFHYRQAGRNCNTLHRLGTKLFSPEWLCFENSLRLFDPDFKQGDEEPPSDKPLYYMALNGCLGLVKLLVDGDANVNAGGGDYGSALQAASDSGYVEVVLLLLDTGADINAQGGLHGSALHAASANGHLEVVRLLLESLRLHWLGPVVASQFPPDHVVLH